MLTSIGLGWHGRLFRDTHFRSPLELESNDSPKLLIAQTLNNSINIFKNKYKYEFKLFLTIKHLWMINISDLSIAQ